MRLTRRAADPSARIDGEVLPDVPKPLQDSGFLFELENELGFALPGLLKALYLQVGDGGFGPGYGLFGAKSGHYFSDEPFTLAELYDNALQARRLACRNATNLRVGMRLPLLH